MRLAEARALSPELRLALPRPCESASLLTLTWWVGTDIAPRRPGGWAALGSAEVSDRAPVSLVVAASRLIGWDRQPVSVT
jgi:hypothetical protein